MGLAVSQGRHSPRRGITPSHRLRHRLQTCPPPDSDAVHLRVLGPSWSAEVGCRRITSFQQQSTRTVGCPLARGPGCRFSHSEHGPHAGGFQAVRSRSGGMGAPRHPLRLRHRRGDRRCPVVAGALSRRGEGTPLAARRRRRRGLLPLVDGPSDLCHRPHTAAVATADRRPGRVSHHPDVPDGMGTRPDPGLCLRRARQPHRRRRQPVARNRGLGRGGRRRRSVRRQPWPCPNLHPTARRIWACGADCTRHPLRHRPSGRERRPSRGSRGFTPPFRSATSHHARDCQRRLRRDRRTRHRDRLELAVRGALWLEPR